MKAPLLICAGLYLLLIYGGLSHEAAASSITTHTSSYSNTGGNSVGPGQTVVTGDASASSYTKTIVGGEGSNVVVHSEVTSESNGVSHKEIRDEIVPAGREVVIVATSSTGTIVAHASSTSVIHAVARSVRNIITGKATTSTQVASSTGSTTVSMTATRASTTSIFKIPMRDIGGQFTSSIFNALKNFFSFLF